MSEDLIRRSDAIKEVKKYRGLDRLTMAMLADDIRAIPTIEPKRGEWIEVSFNEKIKYMVCSECGNRYAVDLIVPLEAWIDEKHKFCGLCGADMRI